MLFKEFKVHLKAELIGDRIVPDDELLKPLIKTAISEVALRCSPLHLVTDDLDFEVLRILTTLNDGKFIRMPFYPNNDADIIDIDDILCPVIVYLVASRISKSNKDYIVKADKIMNDYNWELYAIGLSDD